jgi:hypothetical protein
MTVQNDCGTDIEVVTAKFKVLSQNFAEGTEDNHEFSQSQSG